MFFRITRITIVISRLVIRAAASVSDRNSTRSDVAGIEGLPFGSGRQVFREEDGAVRPLQRKNEGINSGCPPPGAPLQRASSDVRLSGTSGGDHHPSALTAASCIQSRSLLNRVAHVKVPDGSPPSRVCVKSRCLTPPLPARLVYRVEGADVHGQPCRSGGVHSAARKTQLLTTPIPGFIVTQCHFVPGLLSLSCFP